MESKTKVVDINEMTPKQLGMIVWNDKAFKKYRGYDSKTRTLTSSKGKKKIIHVDDAEDTIKKEYDEIPPNIGRDTFYEIIARKFIGISRRRVHAFLKLQPEHQKAQRRIKKSMAVSVISKKPFERIQIDTIDSSKFGSSPFTLTVIDTFSKFCYAEPLKDHTAKTTSNAFRKVLSQMPKPPRLCQSDNGLEFATLVEDFPSIKFIRSSPHLPQANGIIERLHRFLKMYVHYAQEKKKLPYPEQLQKVVKLYNERKHTVTKVPPVDLNKTDLLDSVREGVLELIRKSASKHNPSQGVFEELKVGDYVRLALMKKSKIQHQYQMWSDEVYQITSVRKNDTYRIKNEKGDVLNYIYQRDYLLKIPVESGESEWKKTSDLTRQKQKEAELKRREQEEMRQNRERAKLINQNNKQVEYKFNVKDKLVFPKKFFELYDQDSDDPPLKRTGIITMRKKVPTKDDETGKQSVEKAYYVRFIDADYVGNTKSYPYFAENVEQFASLV